MSPLLRRAALLALAVLSGLSAAGCAVPDPEGAGPLRYRDYVFTQVKETPDVKYGAAVAGGATQDLLLDVYEPVGDAAARRPAMLWMHGGGFAAGSRKSADMVEFARRFAKRGYVSVSISYRLLAGELCGGEASSVRCSGAALAASEDQKAAVRWLRAHADEYRIDPSKIAVGGSSAGAVASVLTASSPESSGGSGNPGFSNAVRTAVSISGGLPTNLTFGVGDAPILFWHGTGDTVVPYQWAYDNASYMNKNGLIAVLRDVNGAGHVPYAGYRDDMDTQARNWVYAVMGLQGSEQGGFPGAP